MTIDLEPHHVCLLIHLLAGCDTDLARALEGGFSDHVVRKACTYTREQIAEVRDILIKQTARELPLGP